MNSTPASLVLSEQARKRIANGTLSEDIVRTNTAWLFDTLKSGDDRNMVWITQLAKLWKIRKAIDVNAAQPDTGETPLMWAVAHNKPDFVKRLLEMGASVFQTDAGGCGAIQFSPRSAEIIRLLIKAGAHPEVREKNTSNYTLPQYAMISLQPDLLEAYLDGGVNTEQHFPITQMSFWMMELDEFTMHDKDHNLHTMLEAARDHLDDNDSLIPGGPKTIAKIGQLCQRLERARVNWNRYCNNEKTTPPTARELVDFATLGKLEEAFSPALWKWDEAVTQQKLIELPPYLTEQVLHAQPHLLQNTGIFHHIAVQAARGRG